MDIQWYPGHMTKARRQMEADLSLVNLIIEMIDARVPFSGRNPDIRDMGKQKARIIILNKADLADENANRLWLDYYTEKGYQVLLADSRKKTSVKDIQPMIRTACRDVIERNKRRGIQNRPVRAMVAGIPNVGKSTFINSAAGRASAKTGNKPGVTKGRQWIHLSRELDLLDTPGILWPKFDDPKAGVRLALIGSVNDNVVQSEELALTLIEFLRERYPGALAARYETDSVSIDEADTLVGILESIARSRNCIVSGGEISYEKAAAVLLDDFRSGRLGRITLELPEDQS